MEPRAIREFRASFEDWDNRPNAWKEGWKDYEIDPNWYDNPYNEGDEHEQYKEGYDEASNHDAEINGFYSD